MDAACRVCGDGLHDGHVLCMSCRTPHHEDCFSYAKRCAIYGCGDKRYITPTGNVYTSNGQRVGRARYQGELGDFLLLAQPQVDTLDQFLQLYEDRHERSNGEDLAQKIFAQMNIENNKTQRILLQVQTQLDQMRTHYESRIEKIYAESFNLFSANLLRGLVVGMLPMSFVAAVDPRSAVNVLIFFNAVAWPLLGTFVSCNMAQLRYRKAHAVYLEEVNDVKAQYRRKLQNC
ncbi:hypothetical protein HY639_04985 [Candidatus Woesearchaeota archaeon]|nr:hypothetical protein [Candidatus Woesearchaeota archaeon]